MKKWKAHEYFVRSGAVQEFPFRSNASEPLGDDCGTVWDDAGEADELPRAGTGVRERRELAAAGGVVPAG